jgi:GAF domain-containing protein
MRLIELFELQHDEGPCLDAYRTGVPVHTDMTDEANTLWPRFAPHARGVGLRSISALPMRLRSDVIGALNLFSTTPDPLSPQDQQVAQALADIATIGILQERALSDGHVVLSQLQGALESRIVIEQAKGIVAQHGHVTVDDAFTLLRGYTRTHNRLLRQTAEEIIKGTLAVDALIAPTRNQPA